ncbi:MAG: helix-turn-helix domain-containing protein [Beijerinckiaceae bacterium]
MAQEPRDGQSGLPAEETTPLKAIRAITRAIAVIDALCRSGACSLAELSRSTGIAKSTLRRILLTLEKGRIVRCSLGDRRYRSNVHLPAYGWSVENPSIGLIADAARPALEEMASRIVWPSDITVRDGLHMRIIETNRSLTQLSVNRNDIGDRVELAATAVGRAYAAFCPQKERDEILTAVEMQYGAQSVRELHGVLETARAQGYAERGPMHTGNTERFPRLNDRLSAVAMPIMHRKRVTCCINLLWPQGVTEMLGGAPAMAKILAGYVREIEKNLEERDALLSDRRFTP